MLQVYKGQSLALHTHGPCKADKGPGRGRLIDEALNQSCGQLSCLDLTAAEVRDWGSTYHMCPVISS